MKQFNLKEAVKSTMGIELSDSDQSSISNLNEVPDHLIVEMKKVQGYISFALLEFYCSAENHEHLRDFFLSVIEGEQDHKTWLKGRVLFRDLPMSHHLTRSLDQLYSQFNQFPDSIHKPYFKSLSIGDSIPGGFAQVDIDATYLSDHVDGFYSVPGDLELITVSKKDKHLWFRRWIALRMAKFLEQSDKLKGNFKKSDLEEIAPISQWTEDAHKAFEGLQKEQKLNGWEEGIVPGYLGEDALYL